MSTKYHLPPTLRPPPFWSLLVVSVLQSDSGRRSLEGVGPLSEFPLSQVKRRGRVGVCLYGTSSRHRFVVHTALPRGGGGTGLRVGHLFPLNGTGIPRRPTDPCPSKEVSGPTPRAVGGTSGVWTGVSLVTVGSSVFRFSVLGHRKS